MNEAGPKGRQQLQLLLVAARHHLSGNNLRSLVHYLEREDVGFEVTLQLADPTQQPELLELHRLVVTPALIKLSPSPKQVFAGSNILQQLKGWVP
ncbi:MAG: circadian clock KaiB family protein, partial [Cyanobacteriota bacterium]|nr:circadian clock KaiB family protein [Cyanobacteriota bacterium]